MSENRIRSRSAERSPALLVALLLAVSVLGVARFRPRLAETVHAVKLREDIYFFPPPRELRATTLGYRAAVTDLLWAKLLVEYGIHWSERRAFPDLNRYIDAIYALEPDYQILYQFVDTMLVYRPIHGTEQDARDARAYLEKGIQARPYDYTVWRQYAQFIAFLAPSFLTSKDETDRWRHDGAVAMAHAVELGDYPDEALTASSMLSSRFGERQAAIETLRRAYALTDDEAVRKQYSLKLAYLEESRVDDEAERVVTSIESRWRREFPFLTRGEYLDLGPFVDATACAGLDAGGSPQCARDWDDALRVTH